MKPVYQDLSDNCFQACIASIFEIPLSDVSHFFKGSEAGSIWTQDQWDSVMAWSENRGYQACWLDPDIEGDRKFIAMLEE